ncbi:MAG: hypothetical protein LAN71_17220 [Acidobacteriia bacterium]|nr:hypothetical protein [Terriglobia bacterium]
MAMQTLFQVFQKWTISCGNMENVNWEYEYHRLKKASEDLMKVVKIQDSIISKQEYTIIKQDDTISDLNNTIILQESIITGKDDSIDRLNELTEKQNVWNQKLLKLVESQSGTIETQNELLELSTFVKLDDKYR